MELTDLWGVAGRLAARLTALGITTPLELKADRSAFHPRALQRGRSNAWCWNCAACRASRSKRRPPDRKSIMASRSFGRTVETRAELEEAVATYTSRAAEKLRGQGLAASRIAVFVQTNRFSPEEPQYAARQPVQLPVATADTGKLIARGASAGSAPSGGRAIATRKPASCCSISCRQPTVQGGLFDRPDTPRSQARMRAVDQLNRRFGRDTVGFAAAGRRRAWKLRSEFLSPRYTTNWDELLRV